MTHDTLNESGTFDGGGATTRAEALTDATIVTLPSEAVLHAVRNDAELALGFLIASSQARRRSIDTIADLAFAHVLQRVAKFLLGYARTSVGMARGLPGVENLSQAQIAAAAGTVRDMAARALLRLRTPARWNSIAAASKQSIAPASKTSPTTSKPHRLVAQRRPGAASLSRGPTRPL